MLDTLPAAWKQKRLGMDTHAMNSALVSATCVFPYQQYKPGASACGIWPNIRSPLHTPIRYCDPGSPDDVPKPTNMPSEQKVVWPKNRVPTELYEEIASYLSIDDVRAMRLVCKEFNEHVSQVMYKTVVIPFTTNVFGTLEQILRSQREKESDAPSNINVNNIFYKFGGHMSRLGMSFEITEGTNPLSSIATCY